MSWLKSEKQFRKYEPFIKVALTDLDQGLVPVEIHGLQNTTIGVQLRNALLGWRENNWSTDWPPRWPSELLATYEIGHRVFLSTKPPVKQLPSTVTTPITSITTTTHQNLTPDELKAFCLLVALKRLKGPIHFTTLSPEVIDELELNYDVGITKSSNHSYILF